MGLQGSGVEGGADGIGEMSVGLLFEDWCDGLDERGWCDGRLGPVTVRGEEVGGTEDGLAANVLGRVSNAVI